MNAIEEMKLRECYPELLRLAKQVKETVSPVRDPRLLIELAPPEHFEDK